MTDFSLNTALEFALDLADGAENIILPLFQNCSVGVKSDGTDVTEADTGAEQLIRRHIKRRFPEHGILGEEFGWSGPENATYRWILDPIDGTTSFALGLPLFGTLIGLLEEDQPIIGVVHFPGLQETVYAAHGLGCWYRRGKEKAVQVKVGPAVSLEEAFISSSGVHGSDIFSGGAEQCFGLTPVIHKAKKFRVVGDCCQHALVCRGLLDGAIDTIMKPWDTAALVPCIREAGGVASTLTGDRKNLVFGGSLLTSAHEGLHNQMLALLKKPR